MLFAPSRLKLARKEITYRLFSTNSKGRTSAAINKTVERVSSSGKVNLLPPKVYN